MAISCERLTKWTSRTILLSNRPQVELAGGTAVRFQEEPFARRWVWATAISVESVLNGRRRTIRCWGDSAHPLQSRSPKLRLGSRSGIAARLQGGRGGKAGSRFVDCIHE